MHQSLAQFNDQLHRALQSQDLKFSRMLAVPGDGKLSITAEYAYNLDRFCQEGFITLTPSLETVVSQDYDRFYYGVSPVVDTRVITEAIARLSLTDTAGLDALISRYSRHFMLHVGQEKFLLPLARYILVTMARNFALRFRPCPKLERLWAQLDPDGMILQRQEKVLLLRGCPTREILEALGSLRFRTGRDDQWVLDEDGGCDLPAIYRRPDALTLAGGSVYYSGVLLRPLELGPWQSTFANFSIHSICVFFERSTYATVQALDGNCLLHPLLDSCRDTLTELLRLDDQCKRTLVEQLPPLDRGDLALDDEAYTRQCLKAVNTYLYNCFNINQMTVSANIVTADGVLLVGKRGAGNIDSGSLYPSANGNAEIADRDVAFYHDSVEEDFPTMQLSDLRPDFGGELSRETYDELQLDLNRRNWNCSGIILSGSLPGDNGTGPYREPFRRMHFNIIYSQTTTADFESVQKSSRTAAEAFESERMLGLKFQTFPSLPRYLWTRLLDFCRAFLDERDIIESLLLLTLFAQSRSQREALIHGGVSQLLPFIFAVLVVIVTLRSICRKAARCCRTRGYIRHLTVFQGRKSNTLEEKLNRLLKGYAYHPATYACLAVYLQEQLDQ